MVHSFATPLNKIPRVGNRDVINLELKLSIKYNVFRQKKPRHLDKALNEHDLGLYDNPMNV